MNGSIYIAYLVEKYEKYRDNVIWHIDNNRPTEAERGRLQQRVNDFREVVEDLKRLIRRNA